ncbi:MAG: hypothetical protein II627_07870 [Lachnospiraceae bacterium]|nr:hypothetical protein [Lachnospiraceae bacterium]
MKYELTIERTQPPCGGKPPKTYEVREIETDDPAQVVREIEEDPDVEMVIDDHDPDSIVIIVDNQPVHHEYIFDKI